MRDSHENIHTETNVKLFDLVDILSAIFLLTQHIEKQFVYSWMSLKSELCFLPVFRHGVHVIDVVHRKLSQGTHRDEAATIFHDVEYIFVNYHGRYIYYVL